MRMRSPTGQPAQPVPQHRLGVAPPSVLARGTTARRASELASTTPGWGSPRSEPTVNLPDIARM